MTDYFPSIKAGNPPGAAGAIEYRNQPLRFTGTSFVQNRGLQLSDHFADLTIDATNKVTKVTDAGTTAWLVTAGKGGTITALCGATTGNVASVSFGELVFEPDQSGLYFETRVNISAITTARFFVGLADAKSYATTVIPMSISGTTVTSNFTGDGVGWLFDTAATSVTWNGAAAKATVVSTIVNGAAPVASTYDVLGILLDDAGNASFYQNDVFKGYLANAVTKTVRYVPMFSTQSVSAATRTCTADFIFCSQNMAP